MESFAGQIIGAMATSTVSFVTAFVTAYWGYILSIGAVLFIGRWFLRLAGIGR
jgi:hypothetical protein